MTLKGIFVSVTGLRSLLSTNTALKEDDFNGSVVQNIYNSASCIIGEII